MRCGRHEIRGGSSRTIAVLPLVCLALVGCGSKLPTVSGQVTYRTVPLETGQVVFHPLGPTVPAYGTIAADGKYTVKTGNKSGIAAGEYAVTVRATEPPPVPSPNQPTATAQSLIPQRSAVPRLPG